MAHPYNCSEFNNKTDGETVFRATDERKPHDVLEERDTVGGRGGTGIHVSPRYMNPCQLRVRRYRVPRIAAANFAVESESPAQQSRGSLLLYYILLYYNYFLGGFFFFVFVLISVRKKYSILLCTDNPVSR